MSAWVRFGGTRGALVAAAVLAAGRALAAPAECERFRRGDLVTERIEDFDLADPERTSVSFIALRYDPAYSFQPRGLSRPDGLPRRTKLFELNALTGAPLTEAERRGHSPQERGTVTVLVQGADAIIDLDGIVRSNAIAPRMHLTIAPDSTWRAMNCSPSPMGSEPRRTRSAAWMCSPASPRRTRSGP